jgi:MOSC domain-containing protein YiiM
MPHIFQLNASGGGVPKLPMTQAEVTTIGLSVDDQADKKHHGGPERAVCLYGLERILALQMEGHPIYPGSIGENVTVSGLDWERLVPGVQIQLGDQVRLEVTSYATPCRTIEDSFDGRQFKRVSEKLHPGWSRIYTKVIQTGQIKVGDRVEILQLYSDAV